MDASELVELLSVDGLRLLDSLPRYESTDDVLRTVSDLRRSGHSATLVATVLSQSKLRRRAEAKLGPFAERMLFTEAGLEQATRITVAAIHAQRFRAAGLTRVADLGCGIGADAMAMAALDLTVTAVERDEVTAAIAAYNLAPWPNATVVNADATASDWKSADAVYLDPARRTGGHQNTSRITKPRDFSPPLDFAFTVARSRPTGVKLGPGTVRELIPPEAEAQWVSVNGDVVELGLWFGAVGRAGNGIRRAALVLGEHGAAELTASDDSTDVEVGGLGEFLYEPDGAVIRARLIGDLARQLNADMLSEGIAYLTSAEPMRTPFASCFQVRETLPLDVRTLKKELAARGVGELEIKKRGVDIDPAEFRRKLHLTGSGKATLILTRVAGKHVALLADRL